MIKIGILVGVNMNEVKELRKELGLLKQKYCEDIVKLGKGWYIGATECVFLRCVGYIEQRLLALGAIKPEEMTV